MRARNRLATGVTIALVLAAATPPARAQIAPGLSGSSTTSYSQNATEFWQTLRAFGMCFAGQSQADAWALIGTEPDSKAEAAVYKKISRGSRQMCLTDTSLQAPVTLIRGAIAEGLYKRGVALPAALRQEPPLAGKPIRMLGEAARCYVANHRAEADALLAETAPGSKAELAKLKTMTEEFWRCLPDGAQKRAFSPTQIRYRFAETLLRMPQPIPGKNVAAVQGATK